MRQWELFGITDSQPYWTPPKKSEPTSTAQPVEVDHAVDTPERVDVPDSDTIHRIIPVPAEGEEELGVA